MIRVKKEIYDEEIWLGRHGLDGYNFAGYVEAEVEDEDYYDVLTNAFIENVGGDCECDFKTIKYLIRNEFFDKELLEELERENIDKLLEIGKVI